MSFRIFIQNSKMNTWNKSHKMTRNPSIQVGITKKQKQRKKKKPFSL